MLSNHLTRKRISVREKNTSMYMGHVHPSTQDGTHSPKHPASISQSKQPILSPSPMKDHHPLHRHFA